MYAKRLIQGVTAALALPFVFGCGGGQGSEAGGGRVAVTFQWPERKVGTGTRYIPQAANTLVFELRRNDSDRVYRALANRETDKTATATVEFGQIIPAGNYTLVGVARTSRYGDGETLASGSTPVAVQGGIKTEVELELRNALKDFKVVPETPLVLKVGASSNLSVRGLSPGGQGIFLHGEELTFSVISGGEFIKVDPSGLVEATAIGTAQVRITLPFGETLEAQVNVYGEGGVNVGIN